MGRARKESQSVAPAAILVPSLLNECQHSQGCHVRAIRQLAECMRNNMTEFLEVWIRCIRPVFLVSKKEPAVERIVKLVACFTADWDKEHPKDSDMFFNSFLSTLLDWSEASHKVVRFRACQVISEVVLKLAEEIIVGAELWDRITSSMVARMKDKQTSVRVFAARALSRLIVLENIEDEFAVKAYREALKSDTSSEVRAMVVKSMPIDNATVLDIVERVADVSESVRKAAYLIIGEKLRANNLTITQRAMTIERGLAERVPEVRAECEKLLQEWLRVDSEDDPLRLLNTLDVETHEKVGETAMLELLSKDLIKFSDSGLRKFLDSSENEQLRMSAEEALFWRVVCAHIHSEAQAKGCDAANAGGAKAAFNAAKAIEKNEYLESILPATVSDFVRLVENHLHKGSVAWFAARQLLLIAKLMDFTDSTSRKNAGILLQRLLRETAPSEEEQSDYNDDSSSPEWVGDGLSLGGEESWANAVAEFARHVHASSGEFEEVLASALADVGRTCREGGANEQQWLHCLAVTGLLLENMTSLDALAGRAIEPEEIMHSLLLPAVKHLHPEVQRAGVRCLGIFCALERTPSPQAVAQLRLCLQSLQVRKMALKAMFDLILCHGAAAIDRAASEELQFGLGLPTPHPRPPGHHIPVLPVEQSGRSRSVVPILDILEDCLRGELLYEDNEDRTEYINQMIGVAAEGFAKVLLQNKRFPDVRLIQERIVQELLMLYFSPGTTHSPRLKQCLAVFFRIWCSLSAANKRCISAVFIPVMRKKWPGIFGTSEGPVVVARKNALQVAQFMLHLLQLPINSKVNQGTNQQIPHREDDGAVFNNEERASPAPEREDTVDEGHEKLCARICEEIKGQARKFTELKMARKTYTVMLCRVITSLRFSPANQKNIKALLSLISRVIDWIPTTEKMAMKALGEALARLKILDETPDIGLTDEELELFMARLGFHDFFKEESTPDPSSPEQRSVSRTGGRRVPGASRTRAISQTSIPASTRSLRNTTEGRTTRGRGRVQASATTNSARKNLSSVYKSTSDGSDCSTISSASDSDSE